jgi:outer membrane protein assembly factor BamE (lipoprotein component of BamABCDE complex)
MKRSLGRILALSLVTALTACAGTPFKWDDARQVKQGMSQTEVTALLGQPYMVRTAGEGTIYTWSHANGMTGSSQAISIPFDKDGKVSKVPVIPEGFR